MKKVGKHTAAVLDKIRKDIKDLQSKTREDKKKDRQTELLNVSAGERGSQCDDCRAEGHKVSGKRRSEADELVATRANAAADGTVHSWPASREPTLMGEHSIVGRGDTEFHQMQGELSLAALSSVRCCSQHLGLNRITQCAHVGHMCARGAESGHVALGSQAGRIGCLDGVGEP